MAGMNIRKGRRRVPRQHGRRAHPLPAARGGDARDPRHHRHRRLGVDPPHQRRAPTNKVEDYENLYALFFEVIDGKIHTQVEMLDFRVSAEKFDLTALEAT